ncbi:hypothetical protein KEJ25_09455 [Candidatus Bathyarchaeota archaeon]|nr:hypothetical protein [Candidatus Bathyarchaeota archaeon]
MKKYKASIRLKYRGRDVTPRVSERLKGYMRENWGSPFIMAFMAMLMIAAGYLCYGLESIANEIAVYAYYSLVIGVVLQFVCYLKYGGDGD